ncbi:MAG: hypothetical protein ABRQ39_25955 [Candidatus Eremiobacterota bacterium]
MDKATSRNKQKLTKLYLLFNQLCPIQINEYEFKYLTEQVMKINKERFTKEEFSTLNNKKKDDNIYIHMVPENMMKMDTDLFVKNFSESILIWKNILNKNKRKLYEIFFLMNILEDDNDNVFEKNLSDITSWLLCKVMYPKLQQLKIMCCNERMYFMVLKIPNNQQKRGYKNITVRHIDVYCIK